MGSSRRAGRRAAGVKPAPRGGVRYW